MLQVQMSINGVLINSIIIVNKGPAIEKHPHWCRYEYEQWIHGRAEVVQGEVCHDSLDCANELVLSVLTNIKENEND